MYSHINMIHWKHGGSFIYVPQPLCATNLPIPPTPAALRLFDRWSLKLGRWFYVTGSGQAASRTDSHIIVGDRLATALSFAGQVRVLTRPMQDSGLEEDRRAEPGYTGGFTAHN